MKTQQFAKLGLAALAIGAACSSADATLSYDLRATMVNGLPTADPKHVSVAPGDNVTFSIFAIVTGSGATFEGLQSGFFSLLSNPVVGSFIGAWNGPATLHPDFSAAGFNGGTPTDTNGDLINDRLGAQRTVSAQSAAPFDIIYRAGATPNYMSGTDVANGREFTLATAVFSVQLITGGAQIVIAPSIFTSGVGAARFSATWAEDQTLGGAANRNSGFQSLDPSAANTGDIDVLPGVGLVLIPEPTAFGMILLGAMCLVGLRRLGVRHS